MNAGRVNAAATLLASGQVLIAGGSSDGASVLPSLASTELYDPATNTFAPVVATASMNAARYAPTATLLASGQVLVAGGYDGTAGSDLTSTELYDPVTNSFAS